MKLESGIRAQVLIECNVCFDSKLRNKALEKDLTTHGPNVTNACKNVTSNKGIATRNKELLGATRSY